MQRDSKAPSRHRLVTPERDRAQSRMEQQRTSDSESRRHGSRNHRSRSRMRSVHRDNSRSGREREKSDSHETRSRGMDLHEREQELERQRRRLRVLEDDVIRERSQLRRRCSKDDKRSRDAAHYSSTNVLSGIVPEYDRGGGPVILTPLIENGQWNLALYLSTVNRDMFAGVESYSGYITVNKTANWNLFFWYFPVQDLPVVSRPLIIWLQGGPGGSSLYGLFNEIGPIQIVNGTVQKMPISWGTSYNLLFIDNPVGTGFSYSDGGEYVTNEDQVGACLLNLLQQLIIVYGELEVVPTFIAGESYAGKYIPALGHYIHHCPEDNKPVILKGLAIGDGWTDPPTLLHYSEWALQVGLVDPEQAAVIHQAEESARKNWDQGNFEAYKEDASRAFSTLIEIAPVNVYNYLKDASNLINDPVEEFLNKPEVQNAIHVRHMKYSFLNNNVYQWLIGDFYDTAKPWLEELLDHYGVMCYSGQLDLIVAYALSVHTYRSLKWSGTEEYLNATRVPIYDEENINHINSFLKKSGNFMDVMVRNAGHMVPADQPRAAKQIIDMFVRQYEN